MNLRTAAVTTVSFLALFSTVALAGPRDDVLEAMGKCAALTDNKARLDCYDAVAPRLRDALNQPPDTLSHPPTKEEQQSWFGFNLGSLFGTSPEKQTTPQQFGSDQIPAPATPAAPVAGAAPAPEVIDTTKKPEPDDVPDPALGQVAPAAVADPDDKKGPVG